MARPTEEIIAEIREVRTWNRLIYEQMQEIEPESVGDDTLDLVRRAYLMNPEVAKQYHRRIAAHDAKILELTKELCGWDEEICE
jgi:hypothetical protein